MMTIQGVGQFHFPAGRVGSKCRPAALGRLRMIGLAVVVCAAAATVASGQTFTSLLSFDGTNGANPFAAPVQGTDGNFYGTTSDDGVAGAGTIFEITPSGRLSTLFSFCLYGCTYGAYPAALVEAVNGNLYGTTEGGGATAGGTVFEITPEGKLTTLYSFCSQIHCSDGNAATGLVQATNGNFYGTTISGGARNNGNCSNGCGTIFEITPAGKLTSLYSFCSQTNCTDGARPSAPPIQAANGNFYGTTTYGGVNNNPNCFDYGCGTVFEITPAGTLTTLYKFCSRAYCIDGSLPVAALVQATNGSLYGTTASGGVNGQGTVFEITPEGKLITFYNFCAQTYCTDGAEPSGLIQATNGNFYGTTRSGGANLDSCYNGCGTVFEITPAAKLTTLYNFCSQANCTDGSYPDAAPVQGTNGTFYGTTFGNLTCDSGCGTVFSLSTGLGPFVQTLPTSGKAGAKVIVLGNDLTGTTSVTFNGTEAAFTVVSSTEITATVPAGATTGSVQVATPSTTLTSNLPFRVIP